jgi:hypothetical protein
METMVIIAASAILFPILSELVKTIVTVKKPIANNNRENKVSIT